MLLAVGDPASQLRPHAKAGETRDISLRICTPILPDFSSHKLDWKGGAAHRLLLMNVNRQQSKVQVQTLWNSSGLHTGCQKGSIKVCMIL